MLNLRGWFDIKRKNTLDKLISANEIRSVIEVGVFLGASTQYFATKMNTSKTVCVDTFQPYDGVDRPKDQFEDNMDILGLLSKLLILDMPSDQAAQLDLTADLIYIDADHSYEAVKKDITLWMPHAKKILCGDDYDNPDVKKAADEIQALHEGNIWWKRI